MPARKSCGTSWIGNVALRSEFFQRRENVKRQSEFASLQYDSDRGLLLETRVRTSQSTPMPVNAHSQTPARLVTLVVFCLQVSLWSVNAEIVYRNPRVYNVDYSFELRPDPKTITRSEDLKLWIPVPREWDSQKAVQILAVEPKPHEEYTDPEHGNRMLFWDFANAPEPPPYKVTITYRLEHYEVHAEVDPNRIGLYDKTTRDYILYTRSTQNITVSGKVKELSRAAIGNQTNAYIQAEKIFEFVRKNVRRKAHRHDWGIGTDVLLNNSFYDAETKENYYEGECTQQARLFVAMCRSVGIPARTVQGFVGHAPWAEKKDLKLFRRIELELSRDGLSGARHYSAGIPHGWAEFYIPNHGWIPADPYQGRFGHLNNARIITDKGCDIRVGPNAPPREGQGYGFQWVAMHDSRVDTLCSGVWNIGKIRIAEVTLLHRSDPFPADAWAAHSEQLYPATDAAGRLQDWRTKLLTQFRAATRTSVEPLAALQMAYEGRAELVHHRESMICSHLQDVVGKEVLSRIMRKYIDERVSTGEAVPVSRFQRLAEEINGQPLDWFFSQWLDETDLPLLKLERVKCRRSAGRWLVTGSVVQTGNRVFVLPIEVLVNTAEGSERQALRLESMSTEFEFAANHRPTTLLLDPDYKVPSLRWMPLRLWMFWDVYPNLTVVYGTRKEAASNRSAAERFNADYLGLDEDIIRADVEVDPKNLEKECIILFGRPASNRTADVFRDAFPIRFEEDRFHWEGTSYGEPTQGVVQIVENPQNPAQLLILYAGVRKEGTLRICDSYMYDPDASFVVFQGNQILHRGLWKPHGAMVWRFVE